MTNERSQASGSIHGYRRTNPSWGSITVVCLFLFLLTPVAVASASERAEAGRDVRPTSGSPITPQIITDDGLAPLAPNSWTNQNPAVRPPWRNGAATAYDSVRDRVLHFGGWNGQVNKIDTWAYDYNTNTWSNRSPSVNPSGRSQLSAAYDSESDRTIIYGGGTNGGILSSETWAYNYGSNAWTNMSPPLAPPERVDYSMAYDAQSDRVIIYGGYAPNAAKSDTWAYDYNTNSWTQMSPPAAPPARSDMSMVYDSESDRIILFGGRATARRDDTWTYDYNTDRWTNLNPSPRPQARDYHTMSYDTQSDRVILFGGGASTGYLIETWAFDFNSNVWLNRSPAAQPWGRQGAGMAYDSQSDRIILCGGFGVKAAVPQFLDDTWYYDTGPLPPSSPQSLAASAGNATVNLTWSAPATDGGSPVTNYRIHRGTSPGGETFLVEIGNLLAYSNTGLTNGQVYYYKVSARNAGGEGSQSNEVSATPSTVPSAPLGLSATGGNRRVSLSWNAPVSDGGVAITNYQILRGTTSGSETLLVEIGSQLSHIDTTVTNNQTYYYQVAARNARGIGPRSSEVSATPAPIAPSAPMNLAASRGDQYVRLSWAAPSDDGGMPVLNYSIYRSTLPNPTTLLAKLGNLLVHNDSGLPNGQTYYYRVRASNTIGEGADSNEVSAIPATMPGPPRNLTTAPGNARVDLSWSGPASTGGLAVTNHRIYRGIAPGSTNFLVEIGPALSYSDTSVTNGIVYYYQVSAKTAFGEGTRSNETTARPATVPSAPQGLQAIGSRSQIRLSWTSPGSNGGLPVTNYQVYRGNVSGTASLIIELDVAVTNFTDSGVIAGRSYFYQVSARQSAGIGPRSQEANAMAGAAPGEPRAPSATPGNGQVVIDWNAPADDGGVAVGAYLVYRGTTSGSGLLLAQVGDVRSYVDAQVTNGQTYYYRVSAKNLVGEGNRSSEVSATPTGNGSAPTAPRMLRAIAGDRSVTLTWVLPSSDGGAAVAGFEIYRGVAPGGETFLDVVGNVTAYLDTGLTNGMTYYYQVAARNLNGLGPRSIESAATPVDPSVLPTEPLDLRIVPGDATIGLTWSPPASSGSGAVTNYIIYRSLAPGSETPLLTLGPVLSYIDNGLINGVRYYYRVGAVTQFGLGPLSEGRNGIPDIPLRPPSAPVDLQAEAGDSVVSLSWKPPMADGGAPVTGYVIYRTDASGSMRELARVGNTLSFKDLGVTNGERYYYVVSAMNIAGEGPMSAAASALPESPVEDLPTPTSTPAEGFGPAVVLGAFVLIAIVFGIAALRFRHRTS